jgi:hypothetical protein
MHLPRIAIIPLFLVASSAQAADFTPCQSDPERQRARSEELQKIVNADQADRQDSDRLFNDPVFRNKILRRDLKRRKRVGVIFGEGCFKDARDFAAAALVYQHGDVPEHYFQTYVWSKRAVELGDVSQKRLMGLGIDRYLVKIGQKQLFASQATKVNGSKCWCLEQVEPTFPEETRVEIANKTLAQALDWVKELNKDEPSCSEPKQCEDKPLEPTPTGSIPGLW